MPEIELAVALLRVPYAPVLDGRDVRRLRLALDLTQEDAAELVGVTLNTWSRWERGVLEPQPLMRAHLAGALAKVEALQARQARTERRRSAPFGGALDRDERELGR